MTIAPAEWDALHDAARGKLSVFTRLAWPELNRGTHLDWSWHNDAVCEHLQAITDGQIRRLIINIPPGTSKTTSVCHTWPVWEWLHKPGHRWGFAAYGAALTNRDNRKRRDLIRSQWYQQAFKPEWQIKADADNIGTFENTHTGSMFATSVGGPVMGFHYDVLVLDDPLKAEDIYTVRLDQHVRWFNESWESRTRDKEKSAFVIIMQRLHSKDVAGVKLKEGGWVHLNLPMEYRKSKHCITVLGWEDPRTIEGEPLCPSRMPPESYAASKARARIWAAQYQQDPIVADGTVFRENWIQFYYMEEHIEGCVPLPDIKDMERVITSWDLTFDAGKNNDFNAGTVWGRKGANAYLIDAVHGQMRFTEQQWAIRRLAKKWPEARRHLVEEKANGSAVLDVLRRGMPDGDARRDEDRGGIPGLIGVTPRGPKVARAEVAAGYFQSGNVYLPHPSIAPWVIDYVAELCSFPTGDFDDRVDSTAQGLLDLMRGSALTDADYDAILPNARTLHLPDGVSDPREAEREIEEAREMALMEENEKRRERERIADRLGFDFNPGGGFSTRR